MIRKPILYSLGIAAMILLMGFIFFTNWQENTLKPLESTSTAHWTTQTQYAYATSTRAMDYQQRTATATQALAYQRQTQTQVSWAITATAAPTSTPSLQKACPATVTNIEARLYAQPGIDPNANSSSPIPEGQPLLMDGLIEDKAWVHVNYEGKQGFTQLEYLTPENPDCQPEVFDIHFLSNYLKDRDWRLVLEDGFFRNQILWFTDEGTGQVFTDNTAPEAVLDVPAFGSRKIVSTEKLTTREFRAFETFLNLEVVKQDSKGYFGLRFFEKDGVFNELRINLYTCTYTLFENDQELFIENFDQKLCGLNEHFQIRIRVDEDSAMTITVNGETVGPMQLNVGANQQKAGSIKFVFYNVGTKLNFIVVTAPKQ